MLICLLELNESTNQLDCFPRLSALKYCENSSAGQGYLAEMGMPFDLGHGLHRSQTLHDPASINRPLRNTP